MLADPLPELVVAQAIRQGADAVGRGAVRVPDPGIEGHGKGSLLQTLAVSLPLLTPFAARRTASRRGGRPVL